MAEWRSREELEHHFGLHGDDVGARTIEEYEVSAREVIERGTLFEYEDIRSGDWRLGYYDRATQRFTAVTDDDRWIVTHFRCPERYVENLPGSYYA